MSGNMPITELSVRKSNELVSAKYKSTLLENQIMTIALTRIEERATINGATLEAKLYPGELKRLIGDPTHIYRTLKSVSKTMVGHTMFLEDRKGNFRAHAIVTDATYMDGVFTVKFNDELREHILGLERNYTTYELSVLTDFKRNSSFRLYELLKKEIYRSNPKVNNGRVDVEYNISELRFMIGLANADDAGVKNAMGRMGNSIDWDKLFDTLDKRDRKYESWRDLRRYVIEPAQEELEEKSNIRFEFDTYRVGRKIARIIFHVYPNTPKNPDVIDERREFFEKNAKPDRQMEMPRDLDEFKALYEDYVGHNGLMAEDIDLLIKTAGMDGKLVREALVQADQQEEINNYMGWLIACIQAGGYKQTRVMSGSSETAAAIDSMRKVANSEEIKRRVWESIKMKTDFSDFLVYEENRGITFDELDICLEPGEAVREYIEWSKAGRPL